MDTPSRETHRHLNGFRNRHGWERSLGHGLQAAAALLLAAVLVVLPFLWGGRQPAGVGAAGGLSAAALIAWLCSVLFRGRASFAPVPGWWCLAAAGAAGLAQLSPAVSALFMGEGYAGLWKLSTAGVQPVLAAFPAFQWQVLCWLLIAGTWHALACQVFAVPGARGKGRVPPMLLALALACSVSAGVCALAAFIQFFGGYDSIFLVWQGKSGVMSGPYWNRNHFCQLQEMGLFLDLGLLMSLFCARKGSSMRLLAGGSRALALGLMTGFFAVLAMVCIICSGSRAGIFSSAAGLAAFLLYAGLVRRSRGLPLPAMLVLLALVLAGFYGLDNVFDRLDLALSGEDPSGLVRLEMWRTSLSVIALSPWLGSGFGGMRVLAPHFGMDYIPGRVAFDVHNDFIDLAVMLGVPCAMLLLAFLAWKLCRVSVLLSGREVRRSSLHPWAAGVLIAMLAAGGHEAMDYGLKQPANFLFFLALAVQLSCLCRVMPRAGGEERRPWWEIGRIMAVPAVLFAVPAAWFGWRCASMVGTGLDLASLHNLENVPEARAAYSPVRFQEAVIARAGRVLSRDPARAEALGSLASAWRELAGLERSEFLAEAAGRRLGRRVGTEQVWRPPYRPYREKAFAALSPEQRNAVVRCLDESRSADIRLSTAMPLNALAVSDAAQAALDAVLWKPGLSLDERLSGVAGALRLQEAALALYPKHTFILERALSAYRRAWLLDADGASKQEHARRIIALARLYGEQRPGNLVSILPAVWDAHHDIGLIRELAPDNIGGQESLGAFCAERGFWREAQAAYERVDVLNAWRPDEETPETLGNIGFMRRDSRDKAQLARIILERRLGVARASGDAAGAAELAGRLAEVRRRELTPVVEDAAALMARGEYELAEQKLRRIQDDPRALVLWAEILFIEGRLEQLRRVTAMIGEKENALQGDAADRWRRLREKMAGRDFGAEGL